MNHLKKIKSKLLDLKRNLKLYFSKNCYVSIGENCLTDNILSRHNIKSFSTIYSNGRSNLDYVIGLEKNDYKDLLNPKYLHFDYVDKLKVVRNTFYSSADNIYHKLHLNGFEFTHHNIIENKNAKESVERKIRRFQKLKNKKNFTFFYHYRLNENISIDEIKSKGENFISIYKKNNKKAQLIIFTQKIIKKYDARKVEKITNKDSINIYIFHTMNAWQGNDKDIFWARIDDDLIKEMLDDIKHSIKW